MTEDTVPQINKLPTNRPREIFLVASGDLRLSANQECWPAQEGMERQIVRAFEKFGAPVKRAHPYDPQLGHGFIWSQRMGTCKFAVNWCRKHREDRAGLKPHPQRRLIRH